ncbi:tetratricopeptide repeat protein [Archangium gephyra]|uniref:Tetratricopeptide repeat protein n=1 Tax=Archangium gephyra TaxID=48 RepID=A0AAC8Q9E8_9BACT|nr:PEGA domain-containing protein [Archangium gephyra]AKJ03453.1 TonB-dependent receptor [Archangium gephyra]REG24040.1 tetratricopeptide repeat protein [Archangium gephyra]
MTLRHRRMSFPALLVALLLALGGPGASAAEPGPARAAARRHFERGTTLYKEGRYAEAAAAFEAAYETLANGVVLYNLGQCYEKLGELQRAIGYYRDYLRMVPNAEDRPLVESLIARLEKRYEEERRPQVSVSSEPAGARVQVDGEARGVTPWSDKLEVGPHRLEVTHEGYQPLRRDVQLRPGEPLELQLMLTPLSKREVAGELRPGQPRRRVWTWVAAGAAGVATAGAVTLGLLARSDSRELLARPHERAEAQRLHDSALGRARASNLLTGTAGVALLAGTALFFFEGSF